MTPRPRSDVAGVALQSQLSGLRQGDVVAVARDRHHALRLGEGWDGPAERGDVDPRSGRYGSLDPRSGPQWAPNDGL